jgi:hypothetical protein
MMSFKFTRFFYLAANFILGAFFFVMGLYSIALSWSPSLKDMTKRFIEENSLILSLFGLGLLLIGLSVIINAIFSSRRHYAYIKTGKHAVLMDESLIEQYLNAYWKEHFPLTQIPFFLTIKKHSIQIEADLPYMAEPEKQIFLERINKDFSDIFGKVMGYPNEVHFIANFKSESQKT